MDNYVALMLGRDTFMQPGDSPPGVWVIAIRKNQGVSCQSIVLLGQDSSEIIYELEVTGVLEVIKIHKSSWENIFMIHHSPGPKT